MDKLNRYRALVKRLLSDLAALINRQPTPGVETGCVLDEISDHYLLMRTGWSRGKRVRAITLFVRIHHGKFWIEEDWTEEGITKDLLEAGVPKEDIVLAFQPPRLRPLTEFAVA